MRTRWVNDSRPKWSLERSRWIARCHKSYDIIMFALLLYGFFIAIFIDVLF